ncbi:hypothetical protein HZS_6939 [Henneguya salminicola]|nr:hypothetical protein HZS_6939 [Henneguya salminicola]
MSDALDFNDIIIGGDGIIIEIDEAKFGNVKNYRGTELKVPGYLDGLGVLQKEDFFWVKFPIELQIL